jgi:hypothetical protein
MPISWIEDLTLAQLNQTIEADRQIKERQLRMCIRIFSPEKILHEFWDSS